MDECSFCKVVAREAPAKIVWETEDALAFEPLKLAAAGHVLLVSKKHVVGVLDIDSESWAKTVEVIPELSKYLLKTYAAAGINVLHATGKDAQQSVLHFHLHLVPRRPNDGLDLWFVGLV